MVKLRMLWRIQGLSWRMRSIDTWLAKCPPKAPTKARRSFKYRGSHQRRNDPGRLRRRPSKASYTAMLWASCTNTPGWLLVPELSQTT
jgi:hypothetical protein